MSKHLPATPRRVLACMVILLASHGVPAFSQPASADTAAPSASADIDPAGRNVGAELVLRALGLLGVHYRLGGNTPDAGLDCSGLVRHVFQQTLGKVLPRRSEEISRAGQPIAADELKPGDLVFFNTLRRTFSHVGIYIGNNQFVHAPARGGQVRVENMDERYWSRRFDGARRMFAGGTPTGSADARGLEHLVSSLEAGTVSGQAGPDPSLRAPLLWGPAAERVPVSAGRSAAGP